MTSKTYRPPVTITREEFLVDGSDATFRHTIYAMVQCVNRLLACREGFGRELGLTPSQFAVLMGVAHTQGRDGVTIRDLAEHVALASTHVTTEVGRLERAGLLTKRPSSIDRRAVSVSLLPRAKAEIARIAPFVKLINDVLFENIDAKSLKIARQVAHQLVLNSESALADIRRHQLAQKSGNGALGKEPATRAGDIVKPQKLSAAARSGDRKGRSGARLRARAAAGHRSS